MMPDRAQSPSGSRALMDVATRLADWRERPPEQWLATANRYLPPGFTAVLVIAIAYQLATLTWTLVPGSTPTGAPAVQRSNPGVEASRDFSALTDSHLFGEADQRAIQVVPAVVDAPDTTLSLTLTGILAIDTGGSTGEVIISANRGPEHNYRVGQTIEGADGATLHSVYADRVLLDRNGRVETLRLPKELSGSTAMVMQSPMPQAAPAATGSLREAIGANAARLSDILRPAPHIQDGKVVGFRVTPGRDTAAFEALGLRPNDVVTDINGTVLDDPSQGLQIFQSLGETTQANVTVLRDGVPQVIVIDTTQLQRLQENRE
jgi:general secretion pathway protein C